MLRLKTRVADLPVVGPLVRRLYRVLRAPATVMRVTHGEVPRLRADLAAISARLGKLDRELRRLEQAHAQDSRRRDDFQQQTLSATRETLGQLDLRIQGFEQRLGDAMAHGEQERAAARRSYTELAHQLSLLLEVARRDGPAPPGPEFQAVLARAPDPLLTSFYATFEDRFRGSREEIGERVAVFLPDARNARTATGGKGPVVDLGCGRGEWLEVLVKADLPCLGIDNNGAQLAAARARGLPVLEADALSWLREQPPASVPMISAFHLIEHLPFPVLMDFAAEVLRVLMPGGVALLETPNPENLMVGAFTFNFDPTHVKPLPPGLTACLMEVLGFTPVEIRPLHPDPARDHYLRDGTLPSDVAKLLFGPRDYAVLAYKPGP